MAADDVVERFRLLLLIVPIVACAGVGNTTLDAAMSVPEVATPADPGGISDAGIDVVISTDEGVAEDVPDVTDIADPGPDIGADEGVPDTVEFPEVEDAGDTANAGDDADAGKPDPVCNDNNPCTVDSFDGVICHFDYLFGICCAANPMCDDGDGCTLDVCVEGFCTHEPSCCETAEDCFDGESLCTTDACAGGSCTHAATLIPGCCKPVLLSIAFDDGTLGKLAVKNLDDAVGWHLTTDELVVKSPPGALRYANPATGNYDSGLKNAGTVALPLMSLPGGVGANLKFDLWMDIEPGTAYDALTITLDDGGPGEPVVIWDKSKAISYNAWFTVSVDVSAWGGQDVLIVLAFDTQDEQYNLGQGIVIDNLTLTSPCAKLVCTSDLECDDSLIATTDVCAGGYCAHTPNSAYCTSPSDCDDGKPCTSNACVGAECKYYEISGCCLENAQCEDNVACTVDDCVGASAGYGGYCNHVAIPDCCASPTSDCNDGDVCTVDACPVVGEKCLHTQIAGCCNQNEDCDDFDPCTEDLCSAGQCVETLLCCATDDQCSDGGAECTTEACVEGVCQTTFVDGEGCCKSGVLTVTFDGPSWAGFETTADSAPLDSLGWTVVAEPSTSPQGALHYGVPGGTYDSGEANSGAVDSAAFVVPAQSFTVLSFQVHLDTEWSNGAGNLEWDRLRVFAVREDAPKDPALLWDSGDGVPMWWTGTPNAPTGPMWTPVKDLDLTPFKGRTVRLRFAFDTLDADANGFGGVTIDDVQVLATCGP